MLAERGAGQGRSDSLFLQQNQLWGMLWLLEAGEERGGEASPEAVWREVCGWPEEKGINGTSMMLPTLYWPLGGCGMRVLGGRVPSGPCQAAAAWNGAELDPC